MPDLSTQEKQPILSHLYVSLCTSIKYVIGF